jgi:hypothetical protein
VTSGGNPSPAPLRIIAWAAITVGVVAVLEALGKLAAWWLASDVSPRIKQNGFLAVVMLVAAVIALWAGLDLLRLRPWARKAIQTLCRLYVAVLALSLGIWLAMAPWLSGRPAGLHFLDMAVAVFWAVAQIMAVTAALRYLRGAQARAAVGERDAEFLRFAVERHQAPAPLRVVGWLAISVGMGWRWKRAAGCCREHRGLKAGSQYWGCIATYPSKIFD